MAKTDERRFKCPSCGECWVHLNTKCGQCGQKCLSSRVGAAVAAGLVAETPIMQPGQLTLEAVP